jgi:phosphoesterase RecJ-like protein
MWHALKMEGKAPQVILPEPVARMYRFLPGAESITITKELPAEPPDIILVADNGTFHRLGKEYAQQLTEMGLGPHAENQNPDCLLINIDHHISNERYGDINLVDPSCGACGELYYHVLRQLRLPITLDVAINIYAAILTDTGRFSYGNTNHNTFRISSELINIGVDPFNVVDRVYNTTTPDQLRLMSRIFDSISIEEELGYFFCSVTQEMLKQTGTVMTDTEGVVDLMKTVGAFEVCFFLKEESADIVKVSARSNGGFDVNRFARLFGGGGHPAASGFRLQATLTQARQILADSMREHRKQLEAEKRKAKEPAAR